MTTDLSREFAWVIDDRLDDAALVIEDGGGDDDFIDSMLKTAGNSSVQLLNVVKVFGKTAGTTFPPWAD